MARMGKASKLATKRGMMKKQMMKRQTRKGGR